MAISLQNKKHRKRRSDLVADLQPQVGACPIKHLPYFDNVEPADMIEDIIPPEIHNDEFSVLLESVAATEGVRHILEIGSSSGTGSTAAFIKGLITNTKPPELFCVEASEPRFKVLLKNTRDIPSIHCFNMSTIAASDFPSEHEIVEFYNSDGNGLRQFALSEVLRWRKEDIDYLSASGIPTDAIEYIKDVHAIEYFDVVLIDGSEFTGYQEFKKIDGAAVILLDDINTFKCFKARKHLLERSDYKLITENLTLRNGFAAFKRI